MCGAKYITPVQVELPEPEIFSIYRLEGLLVGVPVAVL